MIYYVEKLFDYTLRKLNDCFAIVIILKIHTKTKIEDKKMKKLVILHSLLLSFQRQIYKIGVTVKIGTKEF